MSNNKAHRRYKRSILRVNERGSALVYILIAIALLGALTVSFMGDSGNQTGTQNTFKAVSEIQSQIEFIRSSVQECILVHTGGDITIDNASGGTDPGASRFYPIAPSSAHFTGATIGPIATPLVRDLRCPGNPGDDQNHEPIFGGRSAKFLPPAPALFDDWQWYNGTDGIFFWTETDRSDAYIDAVLDKVNSEYSACEVDVIDASTGGAEDLDSNATIECPIGSKCLRVWMMIDNVVGANDVESGFDDPNIAVYPDEAGCP